MSGPSLDSDVVDIILNDNLILIDSTYIVLNVFDERGTIKPMCIGEIGAFQTSQSAQDTMSNTSASSELQSDQTI
ncbi:LEF-10 [Chrysodeixis includens nucleopolyhedrovirus]|uniref:LEF-10 n=1 Tax=Chrysodeixis includens nucleopolyhedrovirus TaxID=1207438 RepID=A0A5B8YTK7_9ABAC|nr:LEF-10 [Chrysodeixis includens nucleopolyhedrovirus]QED40568.1 LEF-10 [Chrysodeixis includens nucleopolyhedrovirus]